MASPPAVADNSLAAATACGSVVQTQFNPHALAPLSVPVLPGLRALTTLARPGRLCAGLGRHPGRLLAAGARSCGLAGAPAGRRHARSCSPLPPPRGWWPRCVP